MLVVPLASVVRLIRAAEFPTALIKLVTPSVLTLRVKAPFSVSLNVISPIAVLVRIAFAPSETSSLNVWLPVVFTMPPLISVRPPVFVVRLVNAFVFPTAPPKMVLPAVSIFKSMVPSTVEANSIFAPPELVSVEFVTKLTALL